jgi:transcriptional regulator with XRE-family HTH domain
MKTVGSIIKTAREAKGWSQKDTAGRVGISQSTLAKIELNTGTVDPEVRVKLAQVLEIDQKTLLVAEAQRFGCAKVSLAEIRDGGLAAA